MSEPVKKWKIATKVFVRIIVIFLLIFFTIVTTKMSIEYIMEGRDNSDRKLWLLEYAYYHGEYDELLRQLPDYDERYSERFLKYTEMAQVYRSYEQYVFWNDVVNTCEKDDENIASYEKYRSQYLEELSRRMKTLKFDDNRRIMDKLINDAGIELM